jgi:hypothetical protein
MIPTTNIFFFLILLILSITGSIAKKPSSGGTSSGLFAGFSPQVPCKAVLFESGMVKNSSIFTYCKGSPEHIVQCSLVSATAPPATVNPKNAKIFSKFFPQSSVRWCDIAGEKEWSLCVCVNDKTTFPTNRGATFSPTIKPTKSLKPTKAEYEKGGSGGKGEYSSGDAQEQATYEPFSNGEYEQIHNDSRGFVTNQPARQPGNPSPVKPIPVDSTTRSKTPPEDEEPSNVLGIVALAALILIVLFMIYRRPCCRWKRVAYGDRDVAGIEHGAGVGEMQSSITENDRETSKLNRTGGASVSNWSIDRL